MNNSTTVFSFDATQYNPSYSGASTQMELGYNKVKIMSAELVKNSFSDGSRVSVKIQTQDGRQGYMSFNVNNPSEKAQQIGREQFSALLRECQVMQINDLGVLAGKVIYVNTTPDKKNLDKGYVQNNVASAEKAKAALENPNYQRPQYPVAPPASQANNDALFSAPAAPAKADDGADFF